MHKQTLPALHESLIELSKGMNPINEAAAKQITETRAAILAIEGVDTSQMLNYSARLKEIQSLDATISQRCKILASLDAQIEKQLLAAAAIHPQQPRRHTPGRTNGAATN